MPEPNATINIEFIDRAYTYISIFNFLFTHPNFKIMVNTYIEQVKPLIMMSWMIGQLTQHMKHLINESSAISIIMSQ